VPTFVRIRQKP